MDEDQLPVALMVMGRQSALVYIAVTLLGS